MRRLPLILGLVIIVALTISDLYSFFVTDDGIHYFSSEPRRLLYVILLGVAGGIVAFGVSRLSPGSQRKLKLTALSIFATFLTGVVGVFAYQLFSLAPMVTEAGMRGWIAAALVSFAAVAGLVWFEFRQVLRQP